MNHHLASYYHGRAKEYGKVYSIFAEQNGLAEAACIFQTLFSGKTVLEIARGTGYRDKTYRYRLHRYWRRISTKVLFTSLPVS